MTRKRSTFAIPVVETETADGKVVHAYEHPWAVRFAHWINAVALVVMTGSGLQIFAAFPSFGEKIPQTEFFRPPASAQLGGWLGGGLQWHLSFMWIFAGGGCLYVCHALVSGRWRQTIFSPKDAPGVWPMIRHYFLFGPRPEITEPYNPLQKLAYTFTFVCGLVAVVTGSVLYKPVHLEFLMNAFGGFGMTRLWHFLAMCGLLAFVPGHLIMVALHGWNNFAAMLTGWKTAPAYMKRRESEGKGENA
jgi:Ni/Fe-hydrogenase b-type cytochrome subunit